MSSIELLLDEENDTLMVLQQVVATDNAVISEQELEFLNPSEDGADVDSSIKSLIDAGYVEVVSADTPDGIPDEFYAATEQSKEDLEEVRLWRGLGILYQVYDAVERPDEIEDIRDHYPEGLLGS